MHPAKLHATTVKRRLRRFRRMRGGHKLSPQLLKLCDLLGTRSEAALDEVVLAVLDGAEHRAFTKWKSRVNGLFSEAEAGLVLCSDSRRRGAVRPRVWFEGPLDALGVLENAALGPLEEADPEPEGPVDGMSAVVDGAETPALPHLLKWAKLPAAGVCVLLAARGAGKSRLVTRLARTLAEDRRRYPGLRLPLLCDVRSLPRWDPLEDPGLQGLLTRLLAVLRVADVPALELERLIRRGDVLLILDDLDAALSCAPPRAVHQAFRSLRELARRQSAGAGTEGQASTRGPRLLVTCRRELFLDAHDEVLVITGGPQLKRGSPRILQIYTRIDEGPLRGDLASPIEPTEPARSSDPADPADPAELADSTELADPAEPDPHGLTASNETLIERWLARDATRAGLDVHAKLGLMESLAHDLLRRGTTSLHHRDLVAAVQPALARVAPALDRLSSSLATRASPDAALDLWAAVQADVRCATFLVRDGAGRFSFARDGLREHFAARALVRRLSAGEHDALDLPLPLHQRVVALTVALPALPGYDASAFAAGVGAILESRYVPSRTENALVLCAAACRAEAAGLAVPPPQPVRCEAEGAALDGLDLSGLRLGAANLQCATAAGADLSGAWLPAAHLAGADLRRTRLDGASFVGANLAHALLDRASLRHADLSGCDLTGASLVGTQLLGATLTGACLEGADLSAAGLVAVEAHALQGRPRTAAEARLGPEAGGEARALDQLLRFAPGGLPRSGQGRPVGPVRPMDLGPGTPLRIGPAAALSPNLRYAVCARGDDLAVLDLRAGTPIRLLAGPGSPVTALAAARRPYGVAGHADGTLSVWDLRSGASRGQLAAHDGTVRAVSVSADGLRCVSLGDDGAARVWDLTGPTELRPRADGPAAATEVALSADGALAVVATVGGELIAWRPDEPDIGRACIRLGTGGWRGVALSANGRLVAACGVDNPDDSSEPGAVPAGAAWRAWDVETHASVAAGPRWRSPLMARIATGAGLVVTADEQGMLTCWEAASARPHRSWQAHPGAIVTLVISDDSRTAGTVGADLTIRQWDLLRGVELARLQAPAEGAKHPFFDVPGRLAAYSSEELLLCQHALDTVVNP